MLQVNDPLGVILQVLLVILTPPPHYLPSPLCWVDTNRPQAMNRCKLADTSIHHADKTTNVTVNADDIMYNTLTPSDCRHRRNARFPPFRCRSSVAVSPFPLAVAVSVHRCRCRCRMPWFALVRRRRWLAWPATERNNGKIELDSISTKERLWQLFAIYDCNGTEFSYVIFTEQRNFTTAERRNGNGRTATEWWKPGIMRHQAPTKHFKYTS